MTKTIISISIIPGSNHPALGPKYKTRFKGGDVREIYAEHFFDFAGFDPFNPNELVGLEVSEEWVNQF